MQLAWPLPVADRPAHDAGSLALQKSPQMSGLTRRPFCLFTSWHSNDGSIETVCPFPATFPLRRRAFHRPEPPRRLPVQPRPSRGISTAAILRQSAARRPRATPPRPVNARKPYIPAPDPPAAPQFNIQSPSCSIQPLRRTGYPRSTLTSLISESGPRPTLLARGAACAARPPTRVRLCPLNKPRLRAAVARGEDGGHEEATS